MNYLKCFFIIILFLLSTLVTAEQQSQPTVLITPPTQLLQSIEWMTEDYPPYNFSENGKITGIATELLRALYKQIKQPFPESKLAVYPWPRAYYKLQHQKNTCLFSTTYTAEREALFDFFGPITSVKISVIALKNSKIKVTSVNDLSQLRIGLVKQDIGHQVLQKYRVNPKAFVFLKTGLEVVKMLKHQRVDVIVYGESIARSQFERAGIAPALYQTLLVLEKSQLGFACNKNTDQPFINFMQQTLNQYRANQHSKRIE